MNPSTQDNGLLAQRLDKVKALRSGQMDHSTLVNIKITMLMEKESKQVLMELSTLEIGLKTNNTEQASKNLQTIPDTKASLKMTKNTAKECLNIPIIQYILENGKTT
jgi:hypothetical protein